MMRLTIVSRALRLEFELTVNAKHFVREAFKLLNGFVRAGMRANRPQGCGRSIGVS